MAARYAKLQYTLSCALNIGEIFYSCLPSLNLAVCVILDQWYFWSPVWLWHFIRNINNIELVLFYHYYDGGIEGKCLESETSSYI